MFWTLLKILVFVALVVGIAFGAGVLMDTGQTVGLRLATMEFELGPVQAAIALLAFILALWLFLKLMGLAVATIRFLNGDETAISRFFMRNRERRGLEAVTDGLIALAEGDGRKAVARAEKAEKLLNKPVLTNLLIAQASEMKGNRDQAKEYYKRLVTDDRSRFAGVRGLLRQKIEAGDTDTALKLAQKAFALRPAHVETQDTLLKLQNQTGDWRGARKTLEQKSRSGALPRDVYKRRDAVLALQQARARASEGNEMRAREAAIEANRLSPDLIPAAALAARAHAAEGKARAAAKAVKKAWTVQPHPDLAAAFAAIAPDEKPAARAKRFEALFAANPDHDETRLVRAELLIATEDFPAARRALGDLAEARPTARALTIMAAIERGEGSDDAVVRGWLTRALTVSRGPQWVCQNCQHIHAEWVALCDNCGSFDTLAWETPPDSAGPSATGTEMLPLIVGALPGKGADAKGDAVAEAAESGAPEARKPAAETIPDAELADAETAPEQASETASKADK
ncbi:MAG: tetratricopeptide repeat protein [Rhodobacteraceae bacterium]|nr:tetratricopeptide repeat protein [Paracoccaceae bacterium]